MLELLTNSTPNGVNKELGLTQALTKEDLEFFLDDGNVSFIFQLPLVLLPVKQGGIFEENGGKWHLILTLGSDSSKMGLTLLKQVITVQVSFTPIHFRQPGFERPLMRDFVILRYGSHKKNRRS